MNAQLRDLLERIDREIVDADIFAPLPLPSPTYCTCPTPATPEYADMRVYVCSVCSGLVVLDSDEVSK